MAILLYLLLMKTTIDLPDEILHRAKITAAERRTTLKALILAGLNHILHSLTQAPDAQAALDRLHKGLPLAGTPLTRDQAHERHPVP
jgi:hypothetical protein